MTDAGSQRGGGVRPMHAPDPHIEYRPWPRNPRYLAGEDGSIIGASGRPRKPHTNPRSGYLQVHVWDPERGKGRTFKVHTIITEAWHGLRPVGMEAAHRNGVQTDNRPSNLRWATPVENQADRRRHGTHLYGERTPAARLTDNDVMAIRKAYHAGATQSQIAEQYEIRQTTVSWIVRGRSWSHLPVFPAQAPEARLVNRGAANGRARLAEDDVRAIRAAHAAGGVTLTELGRRYGVSRTVISGIVRNRSWRHVA